VVAESVTGTIWLLGNLRRLTLPRSFAPLGGGPMTRPSHHPRAIRHEKDDSSPPPSKHQAINVQQSDGAIPTDNGPHQKPSSQEPAPDASLRVSASGRGAALAREKNESSLFVKRLFGWPFVSAHGSVSGLSAGS
jgi:hypothetical protein